MGTQGTKRTFMTCILLLATAECAMADGLNASGNTLPIGANGQTILTLTGSTKEADFAGPVTAQTLAVAGDTKLGNSGTSCTAANAGAIRWSGAVFQGCNGSGWTAIGGGPQTAESVTATSTNSNQTVTTSTSGPHSLCVLSSYYRVHDSGNGYMSQCTVQGAPGGLWSITAHSVAEESSCTMTCYDF